MAAPKSTDAPVKLLIPCLAVLLTCGQAIAANKWFYDESPSKTAGCFAATESTDGGSINLGYYADGNDFSVLIKFARPLSLYPGNVEYRYHVKSSSGTGIGMPVRGAAPIETDMPLKTDNRKAILISSPSADLFIKKIIVGTKLIIEATNDSGQSQKLEFSLIGGKEAILKVLNECRQVAWFYYKSIDDLTDEISCSASSYPLSANRPRPGRTNLADSKIIVTSRLGSGKSVIVSFPERIDKDVLPDGQILYRYRVDKRKLVSGFALAAVVDGGLTVQRRNFAAVSKNSILLYSSAADSFVKEIMEGTDRLIIEAGSSRTLKFSLIGSEEPIRKVLNCRE